MAAGQPFTFSEQNLAKLQQLKSHYPPNRQQSAVIAALDLGQRQNQGWVSREVVEEVAYQLFMADIKVLEIASFYTMFNLQPVGKHVLQVCVTTPCWLRGSDDIMATCQASAEKHGAEALTVIEVECLGACINAPVVQINDDYYENLTPDALTQILDQLVYNKLDIVSQDN